MIVVVVCLWLVYRCLMVMNAGTVVVDSFSQRAGCFTYVSVVIVVVVCLWLVYRCLMVMNAGTVVVDSFSQRAGCFTYVSVVIVVVVCLWLVYRCLSCYDGYECWYSGGWLFHSKGR